MELSAIAFKPRLLFAAEVEDHRVPHDIVHIAGIVGRHFVVVVISRIVIIQLLVQAFNLVGIKGVDNILVRQDELCSFFQ